MEEIELKFMTSTSKETQDFEQFVNISNIETQEHEQFNNISNAFKYYVILAIIFFIWILFSMFIYLFVFEITDTPYFRFGPNDNLTVIGLSFLIDTESKYILISFFCFMDPLISYTIYDTIFPWVNSSILNVDQSSIYIDKKIAWIFVNSLYLINGFKSLFSIGLNLTQIDFFLYQFVGATISGCITTFFAIKNKKY